MAATEKKDLPSLVEAAEAHQAAADRLKTARAAHDAVFKLWQATSAGAKTASWRALIAAREVVKMCGTAEARAFEVVEAAQNQLDLFEPAKGEGTPQATSDPKQLVNLGLVPDPPRAEPARRKSTAARRTAKPKAPKDAAPE